MAGHGGGAWKVAYADFVTAMMAFFMVMWITAQSRPVKTAIAQYFKNPYGSANSTKGEFLYLAEKPGETSLMVQPEIGLGGAGIGPPESRPKPLKGGKGKGPGSRKPNVFVLHDGQHQAAGTVILFAVASAELSDDGKEQLQRLVPTLLGKRSKIEIRGHATRDPLPPGSPFQDAWQLCYSRCLATRKSLDKRAWKATACDSAKPASSSRTRSARISKSRTRALRSTSSPSASRTLPARPRKEPSVSNRPKMPYSRDAGLRHSRASANDLTDRPTNTRTGSPCPTASRAADPGSPFPRA